MSSACARTGPESAYFRNAAINGLHPYSYEAAAAAAAACAWAGRLDPSGGLGRLDAATAGFQAGLAASQAAFRRTGIQMKPFSEYKNWKKIIIFCEPLLK